MSRTCRSGLTTSIHRGKADLATARGQVRKCPKANIRAQELPRLGLTALPKLYQAVTLNVAFGETHAWGRFQSSPSEETVEQHQCQFSSTDTTSRA